MTVTENVIAMSTNKKNEKKSASGKKKNWLLFAVILVIGILLGIGGYWLYEENRDEVDELEDKTEEVGDRLSTWGKDVTKSTKKLFD